MRAQAGTTTAHRLCAACLTPLYPQEARISDEGWVHADDLGCTITAALLDREPISVILSRLYRAGESVADLCNATGLTEAVVRRRLKQHRTPMRRKSSHEVKDELAYIGGWQRVGMIWKPRKEVA